MTKKAQRRREKRARHNKPPRINPSTGKIETDMHKPMKAWFPARIGVDTAEDGDVTAIKMFTPTGRDHELDALDMYIESCKLYRLPIEVYEKLESRLPPLLRMRDYEWTDWHDATPHLVEEPDLKPGTRVLIRPSKNAKEYGRVIGQVESKYQVELCRNGEVLTLLYSYNQLTVIRRHY